MKRLIRALQTFTAIKYISECRHIHVLWIGWIEEGALTETQIQIGGDVEHHAKWVHHYDHVLSVLRNG